MWLIFSFLLVKNTHIFIYLFFKKKREMIRTNHSLWPWNPSCFSFFTAITVPVPGFAGAKVCGSIHPLKTKPKPPSPTTLSGWKFLVAVFSSSNVKLLKFAHCNISPTSRRLDGEHESKTWLVLLSDPDPLSSDVQFKKKKKSVLHILKLSYISLLLNRYGQNFNSSNQVSTGIYMNWYQNLKKAWIWESESKNIPEKKDEDREGTSELVIFATQQFPIA